MRVIFVLALIGIVGCSKKVEDSKEPSAAQQAIDGATGRAAVRSYLDTKETIKDINQKQKEQHDKIPVTQ